MAAESLPLPTTGALSDATSPSPSLSPARRALRAAGIAAGWAVGFLPAAFGLQRCTMAMVFHRPCPGCGMTRAVRLLAAGHVDASLHMHPLAAPALAAWMAFAGATVWTTWATGSPMGMIKSRLGRATLAALVVVYAAAVVLWGLRCFGLFGGPVPVD